MSVKAAGYVAGYVVARKVVDPINGFEWTEDVYETRNYGDAEEILEVTGNGYSIYAMVEVPMSEHFDAMVYGRLK